MKARSPRAALAAVVAEGFLGRLAFGMLSFAFPLYARHLGLSLAEIGLLVSLRSIVVLPLKPAAGWLADAIGYAGLSAAEAGWIYTLSALVFLVAGPLFGWLSDRYGRVVGLAARSAANIGSSLLYLVSPTFTGILAARAVDDAGKAAFKPAWASAVAEVAKADERRRGRRIGALDTAETAGEVIGPALAGFLWQTGGIVALFGARILIAIIAEVTAMKVFGEARLQVRPAPRLTAVSYLAPPALALVGVAAWLGAVTHWGTTVDPLVDSAVSMGIMLLGVLAGAWAGGVAARAERRAAAQALEAQLSDLRHDVRRSLTVIRGEVELILGQPDAPPDDRRTSSASVIEEVERVDALLRHQRPLFRSGATAAEPMVDHPHVSGQTDLSQAEMRGHLGIRKG